MKGKVLSFGVFTYGGRFSGLVLAVRGGEVKVLGKGTDLTVLLGTLTGKSVQKLGLEHSPRFPLSRSCEEPPLRTLTLRGNREPGPRPAAAGGPARPRCSDHPAFSFQNSLLGADSWSSCYPGSFPVSSFPSENQ